MRRHRTIIPGASYYVTARTNGGARYLESPLAKTMFVDTLVRLKAKRGCRIDNFVVLDDHAHLIITPAEDSSLAATMAWLLSVYAMNYNQTLDFSGHLWASRYMSRPIIGFSDLDQCFNRIDQHPVRDGLVVNEEDWEWCGLRHRGSGCRDIVEDLSQWITLDFYDGSVVVGYGR